MVIKDLQKIRELAEKNEVENWKFRSWLKSHAPSNIDAVVRDMSRKYSALIDCTECANCCESLEIVLEKEDLETMGKATGEGAEAFTEKFTFLGEQGEKILKPPCPMLKNKLCSTYADRPDTCRTYPHLDKPHFLSRLMGVVGSLSTCPIAFNAFEELKRRLNWRSSQSEWE